MTKELLIGCGSSRVKKLYSGNEKEWSNLTTLDYNSDHNPDIIFDLNHLPYSFAGSNEYDEIHAYEVLEHTGKQGDWRFFFDQWSEFHRILKPNGLFFGISPSYKSQWAWGDPSHTRIISSECLVFLSQKEYEKQVGVTAMSDFRFYWREDFEVVHCVENNDSLTFVLKAIKE